MSPEGNTCDRCAATQRSVERAVGMLARALRSLDISPELEVRQIDEASFRARPAESNRIWIAGKPMEDWLGATVGRSRCCSVCGEAECRTVEVGGATFEAIPESLIVRAALRAAAELLDGEADVSCCSSAPECCDTEHPNTRLS